LQFSSYLIPGSGTVITGILLKYRRNTPREQVFETVDIHLFSGYRRVVMVLKDNDREQLYITDRKAWRKWLEKNHAVKKEIRLLFYKKQTGKTSLPYEDAVEEALCFGWIDSLVNRVDAESYIQKFTPRKSGGTWSASNKKRVQKMIKQGLMTDAGLKAIEEARRTGAWNKLEAVDNVVLMPALKQALAKNKQARERFQLIPASQKKQFLWWIESAKREETKRRRIEKTVELLREKKSMSDYYYGRQEARGRGKTLK
jgi:uncharacterized protein YdeI (YjbR/CyaY-like superfamily)